MQTADVEGIAGVRGRISIFLATMRDVGPSWLVTRSFAGIGLSVTAQLSEKGSSEASTHAMDGRCDVLSNGQTNATLKHPYPRLAGSVPCLARCPMVR